jgi:hypothetical protein
VCRRRDPAPRQAAPVRSKGEQCSLAVPAVKVIQSDCGYRIRRHYPLCIGKQRAHIIGEWLQQSLGLRGHKGKFACGLRPRSRS